MMPLFQSPLGITTEISSVKYRGMVIGLACMAWSVGMILMPLLAYLVNRWKILRVVSVVPLAYVFLCWTILPESPRWLLTKRKVSEAKEILVKVAKVNKVDVPKDLEEKLTTIANAKGASIYDVPTEGGGVKFLRTNSIHYADNERGGGQKLPKSC